jgi:tRNA dimethylallyltransferase
VEGVYAMSKVCVIAGLTATGKSKAAINLAKHWNAEIISADSVAVYKHLDIGSAKVLHPQQEGITHHLIDICELDVLYNVAQFQKDARNLIAEIQARGKNVIVVGGTGLYIKALLYDYRFNEESFNRVEREEDTPLLYSELLIKDKESALSIHRNNRKRIIRALASFDYHQNTRSNLNENNKDEQIIAGTVFFLQGDRALIYKRINDRVDEMIASGLVEEVTSLYEKDQHLFDKQALKSIGYQEFADYFLGNNDLATTIALIKRNTRRFAKRQITWFKHQQESIWIDIFNEDVDEILLKWAQSQK